MTEAKMPRAPSGSSKSDGHGRSGPLPSSFPGDLQVTTTAILDENKDEIVFAPTGEFRKAVEHYKIFCNFVGPRVTVRKTARMSPYSQFNICVALHTMGVGSYTMGPTSLIEVGAYCSIAGGLVVLGHRHPIEDIASSVILYDHARLPFRAMYADFGIEPPRLRQKTRPYEPLPIIQNDVWIGQNVVLRRGITIGTGSVVAGGSVVVKDVEPYAIVGGNPARMIRPRFESGIAKRLLDLEWWTIDPADLLRWLPLRDPITFIAEVENALHTGTLRRKTFEPVTAATLAEFLRARA
jgi:virginiamycin A acetyltransferase